MRYPVKVFEVLPDRAAKPQLVQELEVVASNLELVRKLVVEKMDKLGKEVRSLSFSPHPEPRGSVVVYVKRVARVVKPMTRQANPNPVPPKKRRRS